ncbi:MAG TPA: YbhN family protein, partial [Acidimicrobiales bacterium]|nr:YbhN family protein [Acidimicrobiales bacterium]
MSGRESRDNGNAGYRAGDPGPGPEPDDAAAAILPAPAPAPAPAPVPGPPASPGVGAAPVDAAPLGGPPPREGGAQEAETAPKGQEVEENGEEHAGKKKKRRRWLPRTVRHLAELLLVGFILEYFVIPQIGGTHKALNVLASVNPWLLVAGLVLEILSWVAYFELTRSLIPKSSDPGFAALSRIQLSTLGLSHCLPGGNAMGYSLGYRLLMRTGVGGTDVAVALATLGLGSAVVLNVIFWLALVISLPVYGLQSGYLFVAVAGLLLMALIAGLVVLLTRGDQRAMHFLTAVGRRAPFLHPETLPRLFSQLVGRVEALSKDRRLLAKAVLLAAANWLFDAASLLVFLGAFGRWLDPVALLVAYGVANIVAALPITPNGLGVMEATLSGILVGFGTPRTIAIWGVIGWRLVNFWLPIPLGGAAYLSLRVHPPAGDQAGLAARRAEWRARWRWAVELFGMATINQDIPDELAVMATTIEKDDVEGVEGKADVGRADVGRADVGGPPVEAAGSTPNGAS